MPRRDRCDEKPGRCWRKPRPLHGPEQVGSRRRVRARSHEITLVARSAGTVLDGSEVRMTPGEAMNTIEGPRFAALTNLASNLKTFLRIAAQQPEVEALSRAMTNELAVIAEVLQRAL